MTCIVIIKTKNNFSWIRTIGNKPFQFIKIICTQLSTHSSNKIQVTFFISRDTIKITFNNYCLWLKFYIFRSSIKAIKNLRLIKNLTIFWIYVLTFLRIIYWPACKTNNIRIFIQNSNSDSISKKIYPFITVFTFK